MDQLTKSELELFWNSIFETIREKAQGQMSNHAFTTWFSDLHLIHLDENKVVIATPKEHARKIICEKYESILVDSVHDALDCDCLVELICDAPAHSDQFNSLSPIGRFLEEHRKQKEKEQKDFETEEEKSKREINEYLNKEYDLNKPFRDKREEEKDREDFLEPTTQGINPNFTFENFVVGASNKMAYACCSAVADDPCGIHGYNPLFIYGPSGLGKTHLMYAIANKVHNSNPNMTIICIKSEDFLNEMVECMTKKRMATFKAKYRGVDMLMLDDIQFISGKESIQLEFFHTFDALYEAGKQIVVTSDRPPREMYTLEERIQTRFTQGMIIDVQPPEYELRLAILRKKCEKANMIIPSDVITFLAEKLNSNVREIEGAIKKIGAVSLISGKPITLEMVKSSIPEYFRENKPVAETVDTILEVTARKYDVTVEEILGKSRMKNIKTARNVAMYVIKTVLGLSLPAIGRMMNRDYSTVHSNIGYIETEVEVNDKLSGEILEIIAEVKK